MKSYIVHFFSTGLWVTTIVLGMCLSCQPNNPSGPDSTGEKGRYAGIVELFDNCSLLDAKYRIFGEVKDSVCNFKIYALMTGYLSDRRQFMNCNCKYVLIHKSGKKLTISGNTPFVDYETFERFVKSHTPANQNDTLVYIDNNFEIEPDVDEFRIASIRGDICFLDLGFNKHKALLVRNVYSQNIDYFTVYGIRPEGPVKIDFAPYNCICTNSSDWMLGTGTIVDYKNESIINSFVGAESCSDHGVITVKTYKLNRKTRKFEVSIKKNHYDCCE